MSQHPLASKARFLNSFLCSIIRALTTQKYQESEMSFWKFLGLPQWGTEAGSVQSIPAVTHPLSLLPPMKSGAGSLWRWWTAPTVRWGVSVPAAPDPRTATPAPPAWVPDMDQATHTFTVLVSVSCVSGWGQQMSKVDVVVSNTTYCFPCVVLWNVPFLPQLRGFYHGCLYTVTELVLH